MLGREWREQSDDSLRGEGRCYAMPPHQVECGESKAGELDRTEHVEDIEDELGWKAVDGQFVQRLELLDARHPGRWMLRTASGIYLKDPC